MAEPTQNSQRQVMLGRLTQQLAVVNLGNRLLHGQARDYRELMQRLSLRRTLERAHANIARIKAQL